MSGLVSGVAGAARPSLLGALTPFGALVAGDVRLHRRRPAPYALMLVFAGNAALWWGTAPTARPDWATNGDASIVGMFAVFSFMTLPFFIALIMGDPVIRDFEIGVDPLIFSKPVGRATYLLGKFVGSFLVLVCCQACFALTLIALQAVHLTGMQVVSPRVLPYVKHFFGLVVLSSLPLAVAFFTLGALTRNVKVVYAAAGAWYVLYLLWQVKVLKGLATEWRVALDPLLMSWYDATARAHPPGWLNEHGFGYGPDVLANRALVVAVSVVLFGVLYVRFSPTAPNPDRAGRPRPLGRRRAAAVGVVTAPPARRASARRRVSADSAVRPTVPAVGGLRLWRVQLAALVGAELRLLRAERGLLVVVLPLALVFCLLDVAYLGARGEAPYAPLYAATAARPLLLALLGLAVVYVGEAVYRDRTLRVEPLVWAAPVPDALLLLSKIAAVLVLGLALSALVLGCTMAFQLAHAHGPLAAAPYLRVLGVVVLPALLFLLCTAAAAHVLLRDKHVAYAAAVAVAGGLYLLYARGHRHPLYNPLLSGLWTYADLAPTRPWILVQRGYVLALAGLCLALAQLAFPRRGARRWRRLGAMRGALLLLAVSAAVAAVLGTRLAAAPCCRTSSSSTQ